VRLSLWEKGVSQIRASLILVRENVLFQRGLPLGASILALAVSLSHLRISSGPTGPQMPEGRRPVSDSHRLKEEKRVPRLGLGLRGAGVGAGLWPFRLMYRVSCIQMWQQLRRFREKGRDHRGCPKGASL